MPIRSRIGRALKHLFSRGSQNPIRYAFPDGSSGEDNDDILANAA